MFLLGGGILYSLFDPRTEFGSADNTLLVPSFCNSKNTPLVIINIADLTWNNSYIFWYNVILWKSFQLRYRLSVLVCSHINAIYTLTMNSGLTKENPANSVWSRFIINNLSVGVILGASLVNSRSKLLTSFRLFCNKELKK